MSGKSTRAANIRTLSEMRALSLNPKEHKDEYVNHNALRTRINELESRIRALEFMLSSNPHSMEQAESIKSYPPAYGATRPTLPTRPLF